VSEADAAPRLSEDQFARLAAAGDAERVEAGRVLYASGDAGYDLVLLRTATAEVVRDATATEPERLVYRRGPGDFLGELNLLTGQSVFLTARVVEAGEVVRVPSGALRRVMAEHGDVADVMVDELRQRRGLMQEVAASALELVARVDSRGGRELRTFAARMQLPHTAYDADSAQGRTFMAAHGLDDDDLPAAVVADRVLTRATTRAVADAIGLTYEPSGVDVDVVVVGAGPAGLGAAVYGASEGLVTVVFDATGPGGQAATTSRIENYLGFPEGISGEELTRRALVQAQKFGAQLYTPCEVAGVERSDPDALTLRLHDGAEVRTRAVVVATGARYRRLDVPGWERFEARGHVRYSATELDARDCTGDPVTVIGGANSAGQAALFLASRGSRVDLVVRADDVRASMSAYLVDRLVSHDAVDVHTATQVRELHGVERLESVSVEGPDGATRRLTTRALFCFIGASPDTAWLGDVARDERGFLLTGADLPDGLSGDERALPFQTSEPRIFAAGDVRVGCMRRVAAAVGEGAGALSSVHVLLGR
jgi:thioredoxin reductase (NADPH)